MTRRNRSGFTLVELMVAIFVSTIVLGAVYGVWMRVQRQIARSHAKQSLQNELRAIANQMQKDFKAIKNESLEVPPGDQSTDGTRMKIIFERFVESEEGKIAQDSTMRVEYQLRNGILTRTTESELKTMSVFIESVQLARSVDELSLGATDLESADEDFKAGREAKLDISIAAKRRVAGSRDEMFHIEKTSLVMRDEFYRKTNKTYVSNFDLAKKNVDEVLAKDASQDANFGPNATYSLEMLSALQDEQLRGMRQTQGDIMRQATESLNLINGDISSTNTGNNGWDQFWDKAWFFNGVNDSTKVADWRSDLAEAETIAQVNEVVKNLDEFVTKKEEDFHKDSIPGFENMSESQKQLYKKAYDMKVQDRTIRKANEKLREQDPNHQDIPLVIDTFTNMSDTTYTDDSGNSQTISVSSNSQVQQETTELRNAYNSINVDWMDDDEDKVTAYNAAKSLINQAKSKRDTIELANRCGGNIAMINQVLDSR